MLEEYLFNFQVPRDEAYRDSAHLAGSYGFVKTSLRGIVKDYMLASLLREYLSKDRKDSVRSVFADYRNSMGHSMLRRYIDSLIDAPMVSRARVGDLSMIRFEDRHHDVVRLKDLAGTQPIVVDCWATWCRPCLQQQPFVDKLAARYEGKVRFVSLSLDVAITKWDRWLMAHGQGTPILQWHAPGGFNNVLATQLSIGAIPRFLLLSGDGKVLNDNLPLPSRHLDAFEEALRNALRPGK